jgi:hypothetical protein
MVIIDFSGLCIAGVMGDLQSIRGQQIDESYVRHMTYNTLRYNVSRFKVEYGPEIVIAIDSRSWRHQVFPYYKGNRKKDTQIDWHLLYEHINTISNDVKMYFPYKTLEVPGAEADDIIAAMTQYKHVMNQRTGSDEKTLIISRDKDMKQLQRFSNVVQWSPVDKAFVRSEDPENDLRDFIFKGDSGDGIPNVLSDADSFAMKKRQKPLTEKRKAELRSMNFETTSDYALKRNFERNRELIDFRYIPKEVTRSILQSYLECQAPSNDLLYGHLVDKKMKLMTQYVNEF